MIHEGLLIGKGFLCKEFLQRSTIKGQSCAISVRSMLNNKHEDLKSNYIFNKYWDYVIIFAGIKRQRGDSKIEFENNKVISKLVVKLLENIKCSHLIMISSLAVYNEKTIISLSRPDFKECTSYYGKAKILLENEIRNLSEYKNTPLTILRPPLIYGVNDDTIGYGPTRFVKQAITSRLIEIFGDGSERRCFLSIGDFCNVLDTVLNERMLGEFNLCPYTSSYIEVFETISKELDYIQLVKLPRTGEKFDILIDRNITPIISYRPLAIGIYELINDYKKILNHDH